MMTSYIDYIAIAVFLLVCMGIGIFHGWRGKKLQTPEYYLLGNRHLKLFPVAISVFVTYQSAISMMGFPAEIYTYGIMIIWMYVGFSCCYVFGSFTIVPMIHPLGITSAFEYLELRFKSRSVRLLGTCLSMLQTTLYMGITLYVPALALKTVVNIPLWATVVIAGGVSITYTAVGGIKSVVWTDTFQFFILFGGTIAVLIKGFVELGDLEIFTRIVVEGKRAQFYDFSFDPRVRHTTWGLLIGSFFTTLQNLCSQSCVQRISSVKTEFSAKCALWLSVVCLIVTAVPTIILGLVLYAYYNLKGCDPIEAGYIYNANQLMPYFVFEVMRSYPGLAGVYISALFSGSLSTLSSGLNSLAANTVEDLLKKYLIRFNKFQVTLVAKFSVLVYGGLTIAVAYAAHSVSGPVTQIVSVVFGTFGGPVAGLFFLGAMFPFANWIGALSGGLISIIINLWISIGAALFGKKPMRLEPNPTTGCDIINTTVTSLNLTTVYTTNTTLANITSDSKLHGINPSSSEFFLYNISYVWYGVLGFSLTIVLGIIISCLTGKDKHNKTETKYLFPCLKRYVKNDRETKLVENSAHQVHQTELTELKEET